MFRSLLLVLVVGTIAYAESLLIEVSDNTRHVYIRHAEVWRQTDVAGANILTGPGTGLAVQPEQEVTCRYIEPEDDLAGYAPKFQCKLEGTDQIVLVKYKTRETFAEIAASRLLWALGFYADENNPVKLKCLGCPDKNKSRADRIIDDAIIEKMFPAEIGTRSNQGWKWGELEDDQMEQGTRAEIDALKLLAVFIQHTDSKKEQQRLGCYAENIKREGDSVTCAKPVVMIQDLGATFGKGGPKVNAASSMSFNEWKSVEIWNKQKEAEYAAEHDGKQVCIGKLQSATFVNDDAITDPQISEAGRQFLAQLLNQLSDQQIRDLFRVARVEKLRETTDAGGTKRAVTIDDWVSVFKDKRRQITERRCAQRQS